MTDKQKLPDVFERALASPMGQALRAYGAQTPPADRAAELKYYERRAEKLRAELANR